MDSSDYIALAAIILTIIIAWRQEWFIRRQNKIEETKKLADKRVEAIKLSFFIREILVLAKNCQNIEPFQIRKEYFDSDKEIFFKILQIYNEKKDAFNSLHPNFIELFPLLKQSVNDIEQAFEDIQIGTVVSRYSMIYSNLYVLSLFLMSDYSELTDIPLKVYIKELHYNFFSNTSDFLSKLYNTNYEEMQKVLEETKKAFDNYNDLKKKSVDELIDSNNLGEENSD